MSSESEILNIIEKFNKDRVKTFAEFIAETYKDKLIEIYLGDSYEEVKFEQSSMSYPAVFCGKVIAAYRECLVISGLFHNKKTDRDEFGNLVFINERAIRALNEINGRGMIEDMFSLSKDSFKIKDILDGKR